MSMLRSSNPVLSPGAFERAHEATLTQQPTATMTIQGTVNKTLVLLVLLCSTAAWSWYLFAQSFVNGKAQSGVLVPWLIGGLIVSLIAGLAIYFKPDWSMILAPVYALAKGLVLGAISGMFERAYPGIVIQAVALTIGTLMAMLMAYKFGLIKATEKFKTGVIAATMAIGVFYLVVLVMSLFGGNIQWAVGNGWLSIGISVFIVIIAALNLVLDFDLIERGSEQGLPQHMEWYAAFGLLVTLVWLYMELLRLLSKLRER